MADFVGSIACPGLSWHATVSTVPSVQGAGQTARPGIQKGCTMTEAAVGFAGNLTDQPELRCTTRGQEASW
jgi:hypothetical protein